MKKNKLKYRMQAVLLGAVSLTLADKAAAAAYSLTNGPGDGTLAVGVDGFGAFGSSVGSDSTNAVYDPVGGAPPASGTTYESAVAIRMGSTGARSILTSGNIGGSGGLTNPSVVGTTTSGSSSFTFGGLNFALTQTLTPIFTGLTQTGTFLTQTYSITNPGTITLDFEMVRYIDGDLAFDGSIADGGGRLFAGSTEVLFEIDSATGAGTATTFVGITAEGGTSPATGRYEVDSFSGLLARIIAGTALDDTVTGDGGDADQFIDAGGGYDVTLALNNTFSLAPGASATYTTTTIFGAGAPQDVRPPTVPEGGPSMALLALGLVGVGWYHRRLKKS